MKVRELEEKAFKSIDKDVKKQVVALIKDNIRDIESCKKTLRDLQTAHEKLLNADTNELELDGYEY